MIDEDAGEPSDESGGAAGEDVIGDDEIEAIRAEIAGQKGSAGVDEDEITESELQWGGADEAVETEPPDEEPAELDLTDPTDGDGLEPLEDPEPPEDEEAPAGEEELGGGDHGVPDSL